MDKTLKQLRESWNLFEENNIPRTMKLWHGGRLDSSYEETISHKKGRWEYGPGLYLTTHYDTALKYSKGSRRLYQIEIAEGVNVDDSYIEIDTIKEFVDYYVIKNKRKEILSRLEKWTKNNKVNGTIFLNNIINNDAIKSVHTNILRKFFIDNEVDYNLVSNAFGWGEMVVVLFNMDKIISKRIVNPKEKIDQYDLPVEFS
jgi:hypothetical protein